MNVSIVIATCGDRAWSDLAWSRAYPSARAQASDAATYEVLIDHLDGTVSVARNQLAERASGDWLCFLDADDELEPGYLDAMAERERVGYVAGSGGPVGRALLVPAVRYVDEQAQTRTRPAIPNRGRWPILNECVIGTLIPRDLFATLGGFREWPSIEDYDLFLRAYDAGATLVRVEDAVYRAYVGSRGRNRDQACYREIWSDHLARVGG